MGDMLGSIGDFFGGSGGGGGSDSPGSGLLDLFGLGTSVAGLIGNIATEKARSAQLNQLSSLEKNLPTSTALATQVANATQPLNEGLVQSVGNTVSGSLAEQGLSQAPGIQGAVLAQSLAPFEQQNQNTALQLVMERLGLPLQYIQTYLGGLPNSSNLSPLLAMLMRGQNAGQFGQFGQFQNQSNSQPWLSYPPTPTSDFGGITDSPIDFSFLQDSVAA
jgi:hypothetical protein